MSQARILLAVVTLLTTAVTTMPVTAAQAGSTTRARERAAPLIASPIDLGAGTGISSAGTHVDGSVAVAAVFDARGVKQLGYARLDEPIPVLQPLHDGPGYNSSLTYVADVDLPFVVGTHLAGTASYRGWVNDLATGQVYDVEGLGGMLAFAAAVDGDTVVGGAEPNTGWAHAYAADARTGGSIRDLGTFGGRFSWAYDVSGPVVVGSADRGDGTSGAFVARLDGDASLVDLGTLGGPDSGATAVDGRVVAGWADVSSGVEHAFATDLDGSAGLVDLGTLGGDRAWPSDVDGDVVVGTATRADGSDASWWAELGAGGGLHDLGTLASDGPGPPRVSGSFVVGTHETAVGRRGFVVDVDGDQSLDLAPLPGHVSTAAADVDGNVVVGTSFASDGTSRAVAWTLSRQGPPAFDFARERYRAEEGARAQVTVVRSGDPGPATMVRYRVYEARGGATAGADFRPRKGTLRFASGQTRATFRVRLHQDDGREGPERVQLRLGDGSAAALVIRASDQRPDAHIRVGGRGPWAAHDRVELGVRPADPAAVQVRLGHEPGRGTARVTMVVRSTDPKGVVSRWFLGRRDVTSMVTSDQGLDVAVPTRSRRAPVLTARVRTPRLLAPGARKILEVKAIWRGDIRASDLVRIRVTRR
jgi:probable HAF family extracellular repeat protein